MILADVLFPPVSGSVWIWILAGVLGLAAGWVLIWISVVVLISRFGDWAALARVHAAGSRPVTGQRHPGVVGWVGRARYKGVLTVTLATEGFFLEVPPLFSFGHPRLFIPWAALGERRQKRIRNLDFVACEVGRPRLGVVALPVDLFRPRA